MVERIEAPYNKLLIDEADLVDAVSKTVYLGSLPVRLSVNAIASGSANAQEFIDGVLASGSLTVVDYTLLIEASATATIEVIDYAELTGAVLTVNGTALTEGVEWTAAVDNDTTALSLELAVEAVTGISSTVTAAEITATVVTPGSAGNAFTLVSSDEDNLAISGPTFTGGRDYGTVVVNGVTLTAVAAAPTSVQFVPETSNDATATNLEVAVEAVTGINSTVATNVVTIKSDTVGTSGNAKTLVVSGSNAGVTRSAATLTGGLDSAVDGVEFTITIPDHGYSTGLRVDYNVDAGTTLDNLVDNTDYFVIKIDDDTIALAATAQDAVDDVRIEIADADDAVGGGEFTLTPVTMDLDVVVSASNDGENWVILDDDTISASGAVLYQYPTPCFSYLKVDADPNESEVSLQVYVHTKL